MKRAERRHHRQRLKAKRRGHQGGIAIELDLPGKISFWVNTPTPCSCYMCRNERTGKGNRASGLTMQELRVSQSEKDEY
jgi:hypothetical protein